MGDRPRRVGGTRGGRDQFSWEDVKKDQHRQNYIGASVKGRVGRWQAQKDPDWWTRSSTGGGGGDISAEARAEADAVRAREEALMDEALGLRPGSEATGANAQGLPAPKEGRPAPAADYQADAGGRDSSPSPERRRHRRHRRRRRTDRERGSGEDQGRSPGRGRERGRGEDRGRSPRRDRARSRGGEKLRERRRERSPRRADGREGDRGR